MSDLQQAKARVEAYQATGVADRTGRTLLAFLNHLRGRGRENIIEEVRNCNSDAELKQLSDNLTLYVLRPMKASGGSTIPPPTPAPRTEDEADIESLSETLGSPQSRHQRWLKRQCLARDNYWSILDNQYDRDEAPNPPSDASLAPTVAAHIVPHALAAMDDHTPAHCEHRARVGDALIRCFPQLEDRLAFNIPAIDIPSNAFIATSLVHDDFGGFFIALRPQHEANTYRIKTYPRANGVLISRLPADRIIVFNSHGTGIELPDKELFNVHFMVAEILHASGAAEALTNDLNKYYDTDVLASDGSTSIPLFVEAPA